MTLTNEKDLTPGAIKVLVLLRQSSGRASIVDIAQDQFRGHRLITREYVHEIVVAGFAKITGDDVVLTETELSANSDDEPDPAPVDPPPEDPVDDSGPETEVDEQADDDEDVEPVADKPDADTAVSGDVVTAALEAVAHSTGEDRDVVDEPVDQYPDPELADDSEDEYVTASPEVADEPDLAIQTPVEYTGTPQPPTTKKAKVKAMTPRKPQPGSRKARILDTLIEDGAVEDQRGIKPALAEAAGVKVDGSLSTALYELERDGLIQRAFEGNMAVGIEVTSTGRELMGDETHTDDEPLANDPPVATEQDDDAAGPADFPGSSIASVLTEPVEYASTNVVGLLERVVAEAERIVEGGKAAITDFLVVMAERDVLRKRVNELQSNLEELEEFAAERAARVVELEGDAKRLAQIKAIVEV